jgi:ATP:corrinoid adenosyltransferase
MIPARPDPDAPNSERKVFSALEQLPGSWTVLHSRTFVLPATTTKPTTTCEIDFLILDPARGLLALEVKGGGVQREGDLWYSIDAQGAAFEIQDPAKQITRNVYALREWLRQQPPFDTTYLSIGWGVVFPSITVETDFGSELPRASILDRQDLEDTSAAIKRLFEATRSQASRALDPAHEKTLIDLLAPSCRLVPGLSDRMAEAEAALVRLTEEQHRIFEFLGDAPRVAVKGGAGSGKTLVAMERARREAAAGRRALFLCFNTLLAQFLQFQAKGRFDVHTFHDLARKLSREAGLPFRVPDDADEKRRFWAEEAPSLLAQAADRMPERRWDSIVVDEAQDFREYWWLAIEKLLADPAPSTNATAGALWLFYDPNQDIFGADALKTLGMQTAHLAKNCRNTARIAARAFAEIGETPHVDSDMPQGTEVETIQCNDESGMNEAIRKTLHRLVSEGNLDPSRIILLTPWSSDRTLLKGATFGNLKVVDWPASNANEVGYCNLQRFKGLEADAVILCEVDRTSQAATPKHLYVAESRAKHVLVVVEYQGGAQNPPFPLTIGVD